MRTQSHKISSVNPLEPSRLMRFDGKGWLWLSGVWFLFVLIIGAATLSDYGLSWDENFIFRHGEMIWEWYQNGFSSPALHEGYFRFYGGFFSFSAFLLDKISPLHHFENQHILIWLFFLSSLAGAFFIGKTLSGARAGFFSLVFLTLTPRFYGHGFNNPKDIPFAAVFLFSIFFILKTVREDGKLSGRHISWAVFFISLTLGIRLAGGLLLFYLLLFLGGLFLLNQSFRTTIGLSKLAGVGVLACFGSFLLTLPWWPILQDSIGPSLLDLFKDSLGHPTDFSVLYRGQYIMAADLPRTYLPLWGLISFPELFFIGFFAGLLSLLKKKTDLWENLKRSIHAYRLGAFVFFSLFNIFLILILKPTIFDGTRQVLYIIPFLAVLAGLGFSAFLESSFSQNMKIVFSALLVFFSAWTALDMVNLHPYQYTYFNRTFGGGLGVSGKSFPADYHGMAHKEGMEWIIENAEHPTSLVRPLGVANCTSSFLFNYYIGKNSGSSARFKAVLPSENPDLFLATTRWDCHRRVRGKPLHVIERMGIPFLYVLALTEQGDAAFHGK